MKQPPNILFLMSDEHPADVTGYEGNSVVRTPVLDELTRTGVVFQNAYTPSPVCVPGQFPRNCGCKWFGEDLKPGYMTFARRFRNTSITQLPAGVCINDPLFTGKVRQVRQRRRELAYMSNDKQ